MSLLLAESFDDGLFIDRMTSQSASATNAGRTGGTGINGNNSTFNFLYTFTDTHATFVTGFAYYKGLSGGINFLFFRGDNNATTHVSLSTDSNNNLRVTRGTSGGTLLGQTDSNVLTLNTWHYIEMYVTLSDTVGEVKLRVDGVIPAGWSDLTSQDTKNGGTAVVFDSIHFDDSRTQDRFDDLYIFNGTASSGDNPNNDLIGDSAVLTIYPDGNGNTSGLDGSDGNQVDNYQMVDEVVASSGDYTGSTSTGNLDTYTYGDISTAVDTVFGLVVSSWAAKSSAGNRGFATVVRTSGDQSTSTGYALTTTFVAHDIIYETNPNQSTEEWTVTNVNAAEFGVVVTT